MIKNIQKGYIKMNVVSSLSSYATEIADGENPIAAINLILIAFVALSAIFGLIYGLGRGLPKASLRLGTIVLSAIVAFIVASSLAPSIADYFDGKTLEEVLTSIAPDRSFGYDTPAAAFLTSCDAVTAGLLLELIVALFISPIVFVTVFIALNALFMILFWILCAVFKLGSRKKSRLLGAIVGTVQGVLVAALVLLPVASAARTATVIHTAVAESNPSEELEATVNGAYDTYLNEIIENPVLNAINSLGGDAINKGLSTIKVGDEKLDAREELGEIVKIILATAEFAGEDFENPGENSFDALHTLADMIGEDKFTAEFLSGILRAFATALHDGKIVVDIANPYHDMLISITDIFLDSTGDTIGRNLNTIVDVYFILYDSGTIDAINNPPEGYTLEDVLVSPYNDTERTVIDSIISKIEDNPDTKPLITALTKFSLAVIAEDHEVRDDASTLYDEIKADLYIVLEPRTQCATAEELSSVIIESLDFVLRHNNILLEDAIVSEMADIAAERFLGQEVITDDDINDLILSYYDAYAKCANLE